MTPRPVIFVGSSTEGLKYAKALQQNLDHVMQVVLWSQGVFGLSDGTLESLVEKLQTVDFAALVVTPDDLTISRGSEQFSPRDNVLLELGRRIIRDRPRFIKMQSSSAFPP
jgi:predicted nucleotide-binding protein